MDTLIMERRFFLAVYAFLASIIFPGISEAYKLSSTQGAAVIEITEGDTISGICERKFLDKSLPLNMATGSCARNVLALNFGDDSARAEKWARTIKPGDLLFFPDLPRKDHDALWSKKVEEAKNNGLAALLREKSELAAENAELLEKRSNLMALLMMSLGIIFIMAGLYPVLTRRKEREFEALIRKLQEEAGTWKPGETVYYEFHDVISGKTVTPAFKVIGSKLKKYPGGKEEPCAIWESPYDGSPLDSTPANNIRNHIRRNIRKADEQFRQMNVSEASVN